MKTVRKILLASAALALTAGLAAPAGPAGNNAALEAFLKTAAIVDSVQLSGPDATSRPWKLTLVKDGVRRFGLWKNIDTDAFGAPDRWRYEIAAYRLDRLLGLDGCCDGCGACKCCNACAPRCCVWRFRRARDS